jgi:hypothetical protein
LKPNFRQMKFSTLNFAAICVFGWYIFNFFFHYQFIPLLWGESNIFWRGAMHSGIVENFAYHLLYVPKDSELVLSVHLISASLGMFSFSHVWAFRFVAWLTGWMIYLSAYPVFDSGMLIIQSFAFLLIFHRTDDSDFSYSINRMIRAAMIAVLIMGYVASAAFKLYGTQWWNGSAFHYAIHLNYLTGDKISHASFFNSMMISRLFTWSSLLYQILFPLMILSQRTKKVWLVTGIIFHVCTIVFFHLWGFALAMIAAYSVIIPEEWLRKIDFTTIRE